MTMCTRREMLFAAAALAAAASVVKRRASVPVLHGDGVADDTEAFAAWGRGEHVNRPDGSPWTAHLDGAHFRLKRGPIFGALITRVDDWSLKNCHFDMREVSVSA